jgi:two-component system sensor histidine kinase KdpD
MKNQQTFSGLLGVVVVPIVVASLLSFFLTPLIGKIDQANIVMLFLLSTFLIALVNGRTSSSISAIVNVGYFDYFFVPPLYSMWMMLNT